eukprot:5667568-Pleurochrysis_carterae.AAC.1
MGLRAILRCSTGSSRICNFLWNLFMYIRILWHNTQYNQTELIVVSLHYRSGRVSIFGWTTMYEWGQLVATLPSDGGNCTSLSLNDVSNSSANHHSFPGYEPTIPGFNSNHLAHQKPLVVKELPGFDPNH